MRYLSAISERLTASCILLLIITLFPTGVLAEHPYNAGPDDPQVTAAAQEALKALGPGRGGLQILSERLDITGFPEMSISGEKESLEELLNHLGARKDGMTTVIDLSGDVLFAFDRWDLKPDAEAELVRLCRAILKLEGTGIQVAGHTDAKGSQQYNQKLSEKRANTVKAWLLSKGNLKGTKITAIGYGETRPIAPNRNPDGSDNPAGRAKNRRVEIRIK